MKDLIEQSKDVLLSKEDTQIINESVEVIGADESTLPDNVKKVLISATDKKVRFTKTKGGRQSVSLRGSDVVFDKSDIALLYKAGLSDITCESLGNSVVFFMTFK